jgi:FlaA1/EpsC-like NDP-sugar epimerase
VSAAPKLPAAIFPAATTPDALWRTPVVIGTTETIPTIAAWLAGTPEAPRPIGCIVITEASEGDNASDLIGGLTVLGTLDELASLHSATPISAAIVSLPTGMPAATLKTRARLRQLGIVERFVPTLLDTLGQNAAKPVSAVNPGIDLVELIGRVPYGIDRRAVARVVEGKRVLITGAGGSIGSELCRIAATFKPAQIILMERSENALFEIDRQMARRFPELPRKALLHDVVDADATLRHMVALRPHTILHSAAHKHVPLMEDHPSHAVTNNLFGTKSIADAALAAGAERFVMISSDKAVNPTSVMGATKRLAEMYVQAMNAGQTGRLGPKTSFTMVRFGNVLGSACSVLPIWGAQLAEGGPITVTDPRMTRYFMTITEAATLVIQAAAIDAHADTPSPTIFVLDMGEPVKILDLAQRFVRLNGFEPRVLGPSPAGGLRLAGRDIDVVFTGQRPGEKLYEELAYNAEALQPTPYPGIMALAASTHATFDVAGMVAELSGLRGSPDRGAVIEAIRRHVPEMTRPEGVPAVLVGQK